MADRSSIGAKTQARRFGRAREARASSQLEDYTELIADLHAAGGEARMTDIAHCLGVAHPTAIVLLAVGWATPRQWAMSVIRASPPAA